MADEMLSALITGETNLDSVLGDVTDSLEDTADAFRDAGEAAAGAAAGMDVAADATEDLTDALEGVTVAAGAAQGVSEELADATEGLGDTVAGTLPTIGAYESGLNELPEEMLEATVATEGTSRAIDQMGDEATESAAQVSALGAAVGALPREATVDVETDLGALTEIRSAMAGLGGTATATVEAEGVGTTLAELSAVDAALDDVDRTVSPSVDVPAGTRTLGINAALDTDALAGLGDTLAGLDTTATVSVEATGIDDTLAALSSVETAAGAVDQDVTARIETTADTAGIREAFSAMEDVRVAAAESDADATVTLSAEGVSDVRTALASVREDTDVLDDTEATVSVDMETDDRDALADLRGALADFDDIDATADAKIRTLVLFARFNPVEGRNTTLTPGISGQCHLLHSTPRQRQ